MKTIILTILIVICCSIANVILRYSASVNGLHPEVASVIGHDIDKGLSVDKQLSRRTGRAKCSAPKRGPGIASRDFVNSFYHATIDQRMVLPTPGTIDNYIVAETKKAVSVIWGLRDNNKAKTEYDVNTSVFDEFKFYQDHQLSEMAMELKGCTMLVIVSRRGVWLGHFWEDISFSTDKTNILWTKYNEDQDKIFDETVIKGMRNGKGSGKNKQQDSLRLAAEKFADDHIKAYLVHPSSNWREDGDYRQYWDRMETEAITHLPRLGQPGGWIEHQYEPTDNVELLEKTARGRLLFKYDANHRPGAPRNLAMLWSETTELHHDAW